MVLCRQPVYLAHIFMPLGYSLLYLVFSLLYYAGGGVNHADLNSTYIYSSLDWNDAQGTGTLSAAIVLIVVPVAWISCFCIFLGRKCVTASVAPEGGEGSKA